jgi:hypothetical protein
MKGVIELLVQTLGPVLYVLLLAGAALGLVVGIMLLVDSARLMRWNSALNRWYSTRRATQALERPVEVKRFIYRWHRVVGVLVFAGSLYTLDILVFGFNTGALVRIFRDLGNPAILSLVVETVKIFLIVGNIAALLAAAVLVFRPSLLKGLETWGDRYYSGREATEVLDVMRYQPDEFVQARPKTVGALVTLSSLYVLATLGMVLLH